MITRATRTKTDASRLRLVVRGAVQGVGFRPFVYLLANELGLGGWVNNSAQGVFIEVEGARTQLERFRLRLETERPPRSFVQSSEASWLDPVGFAGFEIRESEMSGNKTVLVLPDIATCPDCRREILDPTNRRYHYPFTNCTHCGPRFSILDALPYDRAHTSMKSFRMCPACQAEYDDPHDRRFHAQPNACPDCGPQLELWPGGTTPWPLPGRERNGTLAPPRALAHQYDAVLAAAHVIRCGQIVAVKGLGGFHLMVDARNESAVRRLRERKHREEKPFALLFPTLASVKTVCAVSPREARLLGSPEAPIVLLRKLIPPALSPRSRGNGKDSLPPEDWAGGKSPPDNQGPGTEPSPSLSPEVRTEVGAGSLDPNSSALAASIAPGNPDLGVMLPSNPIHHLLLAALGFPVVATSGNLSDEPICTDEFEARERLHGIADVLLVHNRPIVRHIDDSIVRVVMNREMVLRRARGYAPLPIPLSVTTDGMRPQLEIGNRSAPPPVDSHESILAVGAHLKNAVALAVGEQVFLSQHIGDLGTEPANHAFRRAAVDLPNLYDTRPGVIAADLHPDYHSTRFAREHGISPRREAFNEPCVGSETGAPQIIQVQHHIAHVLSCLAENEVALPALGVAWDGTGYGTDGTIWGGEFFLVTEAAVERVAHLRPFPLPGGDAAIQEPRRAAMGLLHEMLGDSVFAGTEHPPLNAFSASELSAMKGMLGRKLNSPVCSSIGRLFDAVASLAGVRQVMRFEGQAAMELEFALAGVVTDAAYDLPVINHRSPLILDWSPMVAAITVDVKHGLSVGEISARFHNALAEAIVQVAMQVRSPRVVLSGGCFQNRYLAERAVTRLRGEGFQPYWHQRVPPNDGGIALGQVVAARRELAIRSVAFTPLPPRSENTLGSAPGPAVVTTLERTEARARLATSPAETVSRSPHLAPR